jgi:hypothetical protein
MKITIRLLIIYLLFVIQTAIGRPQLDLVVLGLIILSLHDPGLYAMILGIWGGFLLGLLNPMNFGVHIIILTTIAFASSTIRRFIYKDKIYYIIILLLALVFKYLVSLIIIRTTQPFSIWLLQVAIILILAIPFEMFFANIFYRQWKMHITENNY